MRDTAYEVLGNQIKVKYESFEWNKLEPSMDIFEDINQVKNYCGTFGNSIEDTACWLDVFNWSVMNKTKLTEDIYQFINHRAITVRKGLDKEIDQFYFNWEKLEPLRSNVIEFCSNLF